MVQKILRMARKGVRVVYVPGNHDDRIRDFIGVHRAKFHFEGRQTWVGNWCWDSLAMKDSEAAKLIACCLAQRNAEFPVWSVQEASGDAATALSDKVAAGKTVTPMEIVDAMNAEHVGRRG